MLHCTDAFQQGNRIPPEQVGKYRQRKQMLDQALKQDAEDMKKLCEVSDGSLW